MKLPYFLYIIYSPSINQYYTGISKNPRKRLYFHNTQNKGWTKRGRPWKIVFMRKYYRKENAVKAENFVKSQKSKVFIEKLISKEYKLNN